MKNVLYIALACAILLAISPALMAQGQTASGSLTISGTIDPSISLVFTSDGSGVTLGGSGTNAATLSFGDVQAFGYNSASNPGVTQVLEATDFTIATPFDITVTQANEGAAGYTLAATLGSTDAANTWSIDGTAVGTSSTALSDGTYGAATPHTLKIKVPFSNSTGTISNSISITATAK